RPVHRVEPATFDEDRRVPFAECTRPQLARAARGPRAGEAGGIGREITIRAAPLRPVGRRGSEHRARRLHHRDCPDEGQQEAFGGHGGHDIVSADLRKIDLFTHILPPGYYERFMAVAPSFKDIGKRMRGIPMLWDLDVRFRVMDGFPEYQQVLSL